MPVDHRGARACARVGLVALVACSDPAQHTDLRPAGPPEVLAVLVAVGSSAYREAATFCKLGDDKRPGEVGLIDVSTVQVCSDDLSQGAPEVTTADPLAWRVRIMFDELLNPDVEELIPILDAAGMPTGQSRGSIKNTRPVTLTCGGVAVPYDGYYSPSGNALSWPLGPSLVVSPVDPTTVPGGTECEVTVGDAIVDKDGNLVPGDQRGPYTFKIAPIALTATSPVGLVDPSKRATISPASPVSLSFNAMIDPVSLTPSDLRVFRGVAADCTGGTQLAPGSVTIYQAADDTGAVIDPQSMQIADASATMANPAPENPTSTGNLFEPASAYRVELTNGATVRDVAGGSGVLRPLRDAMDRPLAICFATGDAQ